MTGPGLAWEPPARQSAREGNDALARPSAPRRSRRPPSPSRRDWVAANRAAILREYLPLLAIPNVASNRADIRRNADHIVAMMQRRGLAPRLLESEDGAAPPLIYGEWLVPGATRTYVLYAHYDGQPVTPADWTVTPPFEPRLVGEGAGARIYGRSASDDKAGVMAILAAVDALRAEGRAPGFNLKIVFEGEEEAGSPHLAALLRRHRDTAPLRRLGHHRRARRTSPARRSSASACAATSIWR